MKNLLNLAVIAFAASIFALGGCEEKSPVEKAGDDIEDAAEDVGDAVEDAADEVKDAVDD
jgi:hypothetical protein